MTLKLEQMLDRGYDKVSAEYASLTLTDPLKKYVQYPEALRLLELAVKELANKKILDIGCGNGAFTRMLARRRAIAFGYDPSKKLIAEAYKAEARDKLGIKYIVADRPAIDPKLKYDAVVSVMVLPVVDTPQLKKVFDYASESLANNGQFVSITLNPDFKRYDQIIQNRRFVKRADGKIGVDFFDDNGEITLCIVGTNYSKTQYEQAAKQAGFKSFKWEKLRVDPKGIEALGQKFWQNFEDDPHYIGFRCSKTQGLGHIL